MTKTNVTRATGGEKKPPEGAVPRFPEIAWRGPFADHHAPSMHVASTRDGCS